MSAPRPEAPSPRRVLVTGDVWQDGGRVPATVVVEDGQIAELALGIHLTDRAAHCYELPGALLLPGLIDIHVHGYGGHRVYGEPAEIEAAGGLLAAGGVTGFLASVPALPWRETLAAVRRLATACERGEPPNLLGIHLEGPYLSPRRPGSQPADNLRPPSVAGYRALSVAGGGAIKMITVAPELDGAVAFIAACERDGIVAAIGHTDASWEETAAGFAAGAGHVTHLYNAMRPFHHRAPGPVGAVLTTEDERITAELILDGHHVHRAAWELARRALGPDRLVLVSDALPPAGQSGDDLSWAGRPIQRRAGRLVCADGTIAGGDIRLLDAVKQAMAWGATWAEATGMASRGPAAVLGLDGRKGSLLPGYDGDLLALGSDWQVALTLIGGRRAWPPLRRPGAGPRRGARP